MTTVKPSHPCLTSLVVMDESALDALFSTHEAWETYRRSLAPDERPDLTDASLVGMALSERDLSAVDLGGANLDSVDLSGADLTNASLSHSDLSHANLSHANLTNTNLTGATLTKAVFRHANLTTANFIDAGLSEADFTNAQLSGADLTNAQLSGADLTNADLSGADLTNADLSAANLTHAKLTNADFRSVKIDPNTINSGGQTLLTALKFNLGAEPPGAGVVRIQMELAADIEPQTMAEYISSAAVVARLASRVGARLQREWFDESPSDPGVNIPPMEPDESSTIRVRASHYGSPWWIDLVELVPSAVAQAGPAVAGAGVAGFALSKKGLNLLSLLLTLARPEERALWFAAREERLRGEVERERANTAEETARRKRSEMEVVRLDLKPASEGDLRNHVINAVRDPQTQSDILHNVSEAAPLFRNGLTVVALAEDEGNSMEDDPA
jgi:uncharacterized protein YjbI with pentapeptide repeats